MPQPPVIEHAESYATAAVPLRIARTEMMEKFGTAVHELFGVLGAQGVAPTGPLVAYHRRLEPELFDFEVAAPVASAVAPTGRVIPSSVPGGTVAVAVHEGAYDTIGESWMALDAWVAEQGRTPAGDFWEVYRIGPDAGRDPSEWRTTLYRRLQD